jgi:hypothetical protein
MFSGYKITIPQPVFETWFKTLFPKMSVFNDQGDIYI